MPQETPLVGSMLKPNVPVVVHSAVEQVVHRCGWRSMFLKATIVSTLSRAKELASTGADTVAVGCPFCSTMVTDGLSAIDAEMEVKDIAELVWEQIKANDAKIEEAKAA